MLRFGCRCIFKAFCITITWTFSHFRFSEKLLKILSFDFFYAFLRKGLHDGTVVQSLRILFLLIDNTDNRKKFSEGSLMGGWLRNPEDTAASQEGVLQGRDGCGFFIGQASLGLSLWRFAFIRCNLRKSVIICFIVLIRNWRKRKIVGKLMFGETI